MALLAPGNDYDLDNEPSLEPFIDTATVIVTRVAACAVRKGITLSAAELELIERWLAAHCYVQSDQTYANKSTGGASAGFQGQYGMQLMNSKYGQMALSVDYSGCLNAITTRQRVSITWLGKRPSQQTDYVDRD
jgi:hypothetical protein